MIHRVGHPNKIILVHYVTNIFMGSIILKTFHLFIKQNLGPDVDARVCEQDLEQRFCFQFFFVYVKLEKVFLDDAKKSNFGMT